MPQKVKISAGYSDKVSENYNSKSYSVSLEMEVQVNGKTQEVEDASARLFQLCRKIVDKQKGVSVDNLFASDRDGTGNTANLPPETTAPNNGNDPASDKQIKTIFAIGKSQGKSNEDIRALADRFNKKIENLTKAEASSLIQELKKAA